MKLLNRTIAGRINTLAGFLLLALMAVSAQGWRALKVSAQENAAEAETTSEYEHAVNAARTAQVSFKIQVQELVALGLGLTATYYIKRSITRPLAKTIGYFKSISAGTSDWQRLAGRCEPRSPGASRG